MGGRRRSNKLIRKIPLIARFPLGHSFFVTFRTAASICRVVGDSHTAWARVKEDDLA